MINFFKNFFIKFKNKGGGFSENIKKHFVWDKDLFKKLRKNGKTELPTIKQLKYFPSLLIKEERKNFIIFGLFFILALSFFLLRIYFRLPIVPVRGGEYTEGIVGKIEVINPIFSLRNDAEQDVTKLIFSGLFKWKDNKISPDLAEKWEMKNEYKNYILYLKKNVLWHDGKNFSADDVIFTIQAIQNDKVKSPLKETFLNVKIKKVDDYTVELILEKSSPFFISSLTFGIIPKHLWKIVSFENFLADDLNLSPIGTGPFKVKEEIKQENGQIKKIVLEKNKKYLAHPAYLNKLIIKFFNTHEDAFEALISKKIDGLSHTRKSDDVETAPKNYNVYKIPLSYYTAIFFNEESVVLKNKTVREALTYAFDKKEAIKDLKNIEPLETAVINNDFRSSKINGYQYSPVKAENKLKEAGYIKKSGWFKDKKGWVLEINLVTSEGIASEKTGDKVKEIWEKFGIKINLEVLEKDKFNKALQKNDYDAILSTVVEGYDFDPFFLWHSSQIEDGFNLSNFKDIKANLLLEKARSATNKDERKKYYEEFQQIIYDDVPAIFLYQVDLSYFQDKKIKGFQASYLPAPSDRFADIENWYVFSKRGLRK